MLNMTCDAGQVYVQTSYQGNSHFSCHGPPQPSGVEQQLASRSWNEFVHPSFVRVINVSPPIPVNQDSGIPQS